MVYPSAGAFLSLGIENIFGRMVEVMMAGEMKQARRLARLTTPRGPNALVLMQLQVSEGLSELFEISVDALSETEDLDFNQLLGQACTVTMENFVGAKRCFNGILTAAEWHGQSDTVHAYQLTLRPWLWLLGKVSDCRIFHKQTVLEIIQKVFSSRGFQDVRIATPQNYPKIEYCVQYRETDLNFVQRLMEEFGLYYFFDHSEGRHVLVLADAKSSHKPVDQLPTLKYEPNNAADRHDRQSVSSWVSGRRLRTGKVTLNDYNFEKPTANMLAQKNMPENHTHDAMESYDYPGRFLEMKEGEDLAQARVEAERATDRRRSGSGLAASLCPGGLVKLEGHPRGSENIEYLVVRCRHTFRTEAYRSADPSLIEGRPYSGSYEFLPSERRFRPPTLTPKPLVHGPQTAVVTGQTGEEIDVDKYGRILVRFHWDREKGQSCRVRVAQIWSGSKWGGQVIPRIGQEVVVEFLEGDPDRPLVTGTVYNADNMPPYELPDKKTMAGVKSNSTKGGGGYNEFVFDDKKLSEKIRMHAEKDHEVVIRNSQDVQIGEMFPPGGASRKHLIISGDDDLKVASGNQSILIAMKQTSTVGMTRTVTVGVSDALTVGASRSETAGASVAITAGAAVGVTAGAGIQLTAGANISITAATITITGAVKITGPLVLTGPPIISPA